jgi:hypothetical protein
MAEQEIEEWALAGYRELVLKRHPARLQNWPILSGYNVKRASLPGGAVALVFEHTGNPGMVSSSGIGTIGPDRIGVATVTAANADQVQEALDRDQYLRLQDGVLIIIPHSQQQALLLTSQMEALLRKHEAFLGLSPMKIFLSHKGVDKEMVRRFDRLLKALGFDTWLDEDAMPAGVQPDRAISRGFKDSCAAVFFVTPDFTDENWLATEIDYAQRERREKGEKFAIITLSLSKEGRPGQVPELLKNFIYKSPAHEPDALLEIVRALPVTVGPVRFK